MSELLIKIAISMAWRMLSNLFTEEFKTNLLQLMTALVDIDLPGTAKIDLLRSFGKQTLGELSPMLSSALSIFITAAFGMLQANGEEWVEKQIGGPVDKIEALKRFQS